MGKFIVSARKYRPQLFRQIKGQEHIVTTLINAIKNNKIASAFLFCGLKGSGKTTAARLLAKALNCEAISASGEPCNLCAACSQTFSLNIHEIDAASHNSADDMRTIAETIRLRPANGKKKIIIIDEAHMLSEAASNVLLKPLEDTPPYVVFILITTEKYKIIPTILSRCQIFTFHQITSSQITEQLLEIAAKENINYEQEAIELISEKAAGSLRDALSMFDLAAIFSGDKNLSYQATLSHLGLLDEKTYFEITEALWKANIQAALLAFDTIMRTGFDGLQFIIGFGQHWRNMLLAKTQKTFSLLPGRKRIQLLYKKQTHTITLAFIYKALDLVQDCAMNYKTNPVPRLTIELMLIRIGRINQEGFVATQEKQEKQIAIIVNSKATDDEEHLIRGERSKPFITIPSPKKYATAAAPSLVAAEAPSQPLKKPTKKQTITIPTKKAIKQNMKPYSAANKTQQRLLTTMDLGKVIKPWQAYAERMKTENHMLAYATLQQPIEVKENCIHISLSNAIQEKTLDEIKPNLLAYLQEQCACPTLTLQTTFTSPKTPSKKPYSDSEKFNELLANHPTLNYLQETFALRA